MTVQLEDPGLVSEGSQPSDWGPFSLAGKNALITGGAMGIGFGIAKRFLEAGANVVIADQDEAAATTAAERLAGTGRVLAMSVDVSDEPGIRGTVEHCVRELGSLDILVNDAGIFPSSPVLQMSPDFFDRVVAVNLRGLVFASKAAGLQMVAQGKGGPDHQRGIDRFGAPIHARSRRVRRLEGRGVDVHEELRT